MFRFNTPHLEDGEKWLIPSYCVVVGKVQLSALTSQVRSQIDRQVVTSMRPGGEMASTLVQDARDVGSIPTLGTIFPIGTSMTQVP